MALLLAIGLFSVPVAAVGATVTVSSVEADPGDTVAITVSLSGNPGVVVMRLQLKYDTSVLTLTDVKDEGKLGKNTHSNDLTAMPYVLYWNNPVSKNDYTANGTLVTLTFQVAEDARYGEYPIDITCSEQDVLNAIMDPVPVTAMAGKVTVSCDHARTDWKPKVPSTCQTKGTDALICRDCGKEMGTREAAIGRHAVDQWIVDREATLTETGQRHGYCTVCKQDVTEEIPKRVASVGTTVIPDSATGPEIPEKDEVHVTVDVDEDTSMPGDVQLTVKQVTLYGKEKQALYQLVGLAYPERSPAALYDILLTREGEPYQPDKPVKVTLQLPDSLQKQYTDWQLAMVKDGELVPVVTTLQNDALTFETAEMNGRYVLLGQEKPSSIWQQVWLWILLSLVTLGAVAAAIVIYRRKRART